MNPDADLKAAGPGGLLPRNLEAVRRTAEYLLPRGVGLFGVESPQAESLFIRRLGRVEEFAFDGAWQSHGAASVILRNEDQCQLIVTGLSVAIEAAGQQRVDLQAVNTEMQFVEVECLVVTGLLHESLVQRLIEPSGGDKFRLSLFDLRVQRAEFVFLLAQPGFEQFNIASAGAADEQQPGRHGSQTSADHASGSELHP